MPASTRRLWFRLDEVLPLAEHAMACRHHQVTSAQTAALGPDGPALILTHTADSDVVTSNGFPRWHDQTGRLHAAHAHTWHDRRTGRRGSPMRPEQPTAYLPLCRGSGDSPPVIDLLRAGNHLNRHWVAIDLRLADQLLGYADIDVPAHRHDLVPADARWVAASVTAAGVGFGPYPALVADGYTTVDGDLLCRFDWRTTEQMAADLDAVIRTATMPGEYPILHFERDELILLEDDETGSGEPVLVEIDRYRRDSDGCYSLGADLTPWQATLDRVPWRTRLRFAGARFATRLRQFGATLTLARTVTTVRRRRRADEARGSDGCLATFVTGGHDPYATECGLQRGHTVAHRGADPFGGDGFVEWSGGGTAGGDKLPYRNVRWTRTGPTR